jgi:anthrone oxygenase-like protein
MLTRTLRFVAITCAALVLGLTLTHVLEAPGKAQLSGAEFLAIQHTFYGGYAVVGGIAEIVGLVASLVLAYLLRAERVAAGLALLAALCFAGTLLAFAFGNNPLNQQIASWTPETLPATWPQTRDAWDRAHTISAILGAIAFFALLVEALFPLGAVASERAHDLAAR